MATDASQTRVLVVGAGLSGSLLACLLGQRGFHVSVFERRPDPRVVGPVGGRSINLALSCRGITALKSAGLDRRVLADAIPMPGRMLHSPAGELVFQPYSKNHEDAIHSVSRGKLNVTLLDAAEACRFVHLRFSSRCVDVDVNRPAALFRDEETGEESWFEGDVLIGADGAFSAVRSRMQRRDRFNYSQHYLEHGYKELSIPPATDCGIDPDRYGGFAMDPNALHIWPRGRFMMIALPNADRSFTCTLFWPFEGPNSFEALAGETGASAFFNEYFPDAYPILRNLEDEYSTNPIGSLVTIRCEPWHVDGVVCLLGDAAHAIVPFYGQGINCGFEDCRIFADMLDANGNDIRRVISEFTSLRKADCDTIADLALDNFIEMRDRVADESFLLRKRIEHVLHAIDPDRYVPLYNLVSFTNIPYTQALQQGSSVVDLAESIVKYSTDRIGLDAASELSDEQLADAVRHALQQMGASP